jgi:hypothetical protein
MSEGLGSVSHLMALLFGIVTPVEYEANLVSYFDSVVTYVLGNEAFIAASRYIGSTSLKISCPCGIPL